MRSKPCQWLMVRCWLARTPGILKKKPVHLATYRKEAVNDTATDMNKRKERDPEIT